MLIGSWNLMPCPIHIFRYAILSPADPLWSTCEAGAGGTEKAAVACMDGWSERIPKFVEQVEELRDQLWKTFPNELDGEPYSGTYIVGVR